ncbi:MAG: hypothetical protein HKL88_00330, partial [Bacteroidia bacterium]|nr:hypothetical protein [Bacteroidia bacterium]
IEEKLMDGFNYYNKVKEKRWDPVTLMKNSKAIIKEKWESEKNSFTDAKEIVLPGIKRWLQSNGFSQFSDISLADHLNITEIDAEIKETIYEIASFAGINTEETSNDEQNGFPE